MDWFEIVATASGLLCVWLLIRQNIWTWPLGMAYALLSLFVFYGEQLYGQFALHVFYVLVNAYGWYHWQTGGADGAPVVVGRTPVAVAFVLALLVVLASVASWLLLDTYSDAQQALFDSALTAASLAAFWMQTRKYLESWLVWLVIDIVYVGFFVLQELYLYAILYGVYLIMAVWGYVQWLRDTKERPISEVA
ncbi:MAG: nicotinamide riboside transporter PnuC [Pseudomonadaceae bacterium]|nr:nicotinamide riboside transporter PnuC [Pseudomonadaceae bacterium]